MGPADQKNHYAQVQARNGAAQFFLPKELLGLSKALQLRQAVFLPTDLYAADSRPEDRAAYFLKL